MQRATHTASSDQQQSPYWCWVRNQHMLQRWMALACCCSEGEHAHLELVADVLTRLLQAALLLLLVAGLVPWPGHARTFLSAQICPPCGPSMCTARRCQTRLAQDLKCSCGRCLPLTHQVCNQKSIQSFRQQRPCQAKARSGEPGHFRRDFGGFNGFGYSISTCPPAG